ncbi:MAG: hypothetical protein M3P49_14650 [Actinomycetota bacterium]|nr:hypothetical protein [Actinomycetota bacterium]
MTSIREQVRIEAMTLLDFAYHVEDDVDAENYEEASLSLEELLQTAGRLVPLLEELWEK